MTNVITYYDPYWHGQSSPDADCQLDSDTLDQHNITSHTEVYGYLYHNKMQIMVQDKLGVDAACCNGGRSHL